MKKTKVTLAPLTADDREQFILDNQWAFKYGAMIGQFVWHRDILPHSRERQHPRQVLFL